MARPRPPTSRALRRAHDAALYRCAYPESHAAWGEANRELHALARDLAGGTLPRAAAGLENSGIAGTALTASFSLAITEWLVERFGAAVSLASIDGDPDHVMAVLNTTLDPLEREVLSEETPGFAVWCARYLGAARERRLERLLGLVRALPGTQREREALFASLQVYVRWQIPPDAPVLTHGRLARGRPHIHAGGLLRRVTAAAMWHEAAPKRLRLDAPGRRAAADLGRGVLTSLLKETDFFSHVHEPEIELHELGRGITIALFTSRPAHKLALESYVGYLLFKNHVPVAYGGGWVLGRQARFGINILPPFRGGESALVFCQLLRLYAWRLGLKLFIVEPYQIGKGNPEGIHSGSFWFYWRMGFRPMQPHLLALATAEKARLDAEPGSRTPAPLLRQLAESLLAWETPAAGEWRYIDIVRVGARVSRYIDVEFGGDRQAARRAARRRLRLADDRLAVLLAAFEPARGWPRRELAKLAALAARKGGAEIEHTRGLQQCRILLAALAGA